MPLRKQSAAALEVWLLTHSSPFWEGPTLKVSQVTVIGSTRPSRVETAAVTSIPLAEVRRLGDEKAAQKVLRAIPASAAVLLHFDIDVLQARVMPAAYFPRPEGLDMAEAAALMGVRCLTAGLARSTH
jgi:arginase